MDGAKNTHDGCVLPIFPLINRFYAELKIQAKKLFLFALKIATWQFIILTQYYLSTLNCALKRPKLQSYQFLVFKSNFSKKMFDLNLIKNQ